MLYRTQTKKYFTEKGSATISWNADKQPYYIELASRTKAKITTPEMLSDLLKSRIMIVTAMRKFMTIEDWDILEDITFFNGVGSIKIYDTK